MIIRGLCGVWNVDSFGFGFAFPSSIRPTRCLFTDSGGVSSSSSNASRRFVVLHTLWRNHGAITVQAPPSPSKQLNSSTSPSFCSLQRYLQRASCPGESCASLSCAQRTL